MENPAIAAALNGLADKLRYGIQKLRNAGIVNVGKLPDVEAVIRMRAGGRELRRITTVSERVDALAAKNAIWVMRLEVNTTGLKLLDAGLSHEYTRAFVTSVGATFNHIVYPMACEVCNVLKSSAEVKNFRACVYDIEVCGICHERIENAGDSLDGDLNELLARERLLELLRAYCGAR